MGCGVVWCGVAWCGVVWCLVGVGYDRGRVWVGWGGWGGVGYCRVMVEVKYCRGRVGSELSQLGSRWFVHACY